MCILVDGDIEENSGPATEARSGLIEEEHWVRYIENLPSSQWRAILLGQGVSSRPVKPVAASNLIFFTRAVEKNLGSEPVDAATAGVCQRLYLETISTRLLIDAAVNGDRYKSVAGQ